MKALDTTVHKWLRIPYVLNVRKKRLRLRAPVTYIFIHGLGDTGELWNPVIDGLPKDANYIAVDLLGFGDSKKPGWARYNATMQARSLLMTVTRLGIIGNIVVVGHSLGALVGVEFAKRYPLHVKKLVLCSPPIYDSKFNPSTKKIHQNTLNRLYADIATKPKLVISAYALGQRLKIINKSLRVTPETLPAFMSSLQASIVNQDTIQRIGKIKQPIVIINGMLDVLTIGSVLKDIAKKNANIELFSIRAGHSIKKTYANKILEVL